MDRYSMNFPCLDLINSEQWDAAGLRTDHLTEPLWLERWLAGWGLASDRPVSGELRAELVRLRAMLRRIVESLAAGVPPGSAELDQLDAALAAVPVRRRLVSTGAGYHVELEPQQPGDRWIVAQIAASAAQVLAEQDARRIKLCANPLCRWVFYDRTRGNTRRWCNDRACGNRDKVRRFRLRQRSHPHP